MQINMRNIIYVKIYYINNIVRLYYKKLNNIKVYIY